MDKTCNKLPENPRYVLDGGDILHKVHWPIPATYGDVLNAYLGYVNRNYVTKAIAVFDGCSAYATSSHVAQDIVLYHKIRENNIVQYFPNIETM
ncbi:hypothetical protein AVEN_221930-1 [Araneus ventricosus]|uniref:Uncharacterized protein n=1 Tax=Araneus ventricosus TaxID=182803 RepID=A0A4Y2F859_ARAVE|nr:hypothetical protein AVEN_221930-1 [Araneus ventricosus]